MKYGILNLKCLQLYEVKNYCCLFERLFKVKKSKKNAVFLFEISFFVLFCIMQMREVMTS